MVSVASAVLDIHQDILRQVAAQLANEDSAVKVELKGATTLEVTAPGGVEYLYASSTFLARLIALVLAEYIATYGRRTR